MIGWRRAIAQFVVRYRHTAGTAVPLAALDDPGFVAIDVETTGLDPRLDALVAVAAVPFVGGVPREGLVSLVNPGRPIPPAATAIHGISHADIADAPTVAEIVPRLDARCDGRIVVGHDVAFDLAMLAAAREALGLAAPAVVALDTRRLARVVDPAARDSRLEVIATRLGLSAHGRHTADGDARMAGAIFFRLLPALRRRGARTVADLLRLQRAAPLYD